MMMQKWQILAALAAASAASAFPPGVRAASPASPPAEVQKALQADYNDRDGAVSRKDIEGTLAHYAPDFTSVSSVGKTHDLKEERVEFLKTFHAVKSSVTKSTIQKVTLAKAGAEAAVVVRRRGTLVMVNPQTQASSTVVLEGAYQDTWDKRGGAWLLTREQASSFKATVDGKPL